MENVQLLNGIETASRLAQRKGISPARALGVTNRILVETFMGNDLGNYASDSRAYHGAILSYLQACEKKGVPPEVALAYATIKVNMHQRKAGVWKDCTGGQIPDFFVASNTSELLTHQVFCNGIVHVDEAKKMHGTFGLCINVRNSSHLKQIDDFVPFAYSLAHNSLPAAIIFFGACLHEPGKDVDAAGMDLGQHAQLVHARKNGYIKKATDAKHLIMGDIYHHFDNQGVLTEIPIFAAVYDSKSNEVMALDANGNITIPLSTHLSLRGYNILNPRTASLVENLEKFAQDTAYPQIMRHAREVKEIDCVDLRTARTWDLGGQIREIGSALPDDKMRIVAVSQLSSAAILGTHTNCGYVSTFIHVHMMNAYLRLVLGNEASHLRHIIDMAYGRISKRSCGAILEKEAVVHALSDPTVMERMNSLLDSSQRSQLEAYLFDVLVGQASDTRETIRHGLSRHVLTVNRSGLFEMDAAAAVEEATRELIPGERLSAAHFNFLVNEEHTRMLYNALNEIAQSDEVEHERAKAGLNPEFDVTALVLDLQSGDKFLPQPHLPQTESELYDDHRELFYNGRPARIQSLAESIMR